MPTPAAWECIWIGHGWKGSSRAGLIQDVAIEASRAVTEIPTWMGLTARWKVKCVSLA